MDLRVRAATSALALALPVIAIAAPAMQPGLWEESSQPAGTSPVVSRHCFAAKDIASWPKLPASSPCHVLDYKEAGGNVAYTLACEVNGNRSSSQVAIDYEGDHYRGTVRTADATIPIVGRRLGACPN